MEKRGSGSSAKGTVEETEPSDETSPRSSSDEDLGTINQVAPPVVKVTYKNPSVQLKSNLKKKSLEPEKWIIRNLSFRDRSSEDVAGSSDKALKQKITISDETEALYPISRYSLTSLQSGVSAVSSQPDLSGWGKIKTDMEELKVRFVSVGDVPSTKIEGWYRLEPLNNIKLESEEYGVDFSNMPYAMKLRPAFGTENQDIEMIITRKKERSALDLPRSGTVHVTYPFAGHASKHDSNLHEMRRRTLSNKSLTKRLQKKGFRSSPISASKKTSGNLEEEISPRSSLDTSIQPSTNTQSKLMDTSSEKETEEEIANILRKLLSYSAEKNTSNEKFLRKNATKYSLVDHQKCTDVNIFKTRADLGNFSCKGNSKNFSCKLCTKKEIDMFDSNIFCHEIEGNFIFSPNTMKFDVFIPLFNCLSQFYEGCNLRLLEINEKSQLWNEKIHSSRSKEITVINSNANASFEIKGSGETTSFPGECECIKCRKKYDGLIGENKMRKIVIKKKKIGFIRRDRTFHFSCVNMKSLQFAWVSSGKNEGLLKNERKLKINIDTIFAKSVQILLVSGSFRSSISFSHGDIEGFHIVSQGQFFNCSFSKKEKVNFIIKKPNFGECKGIKKHRAHRFDRKCFMKMNSKIYKNAPKWKEKKKIFYGGVKVRQVKPKVQEESLFIPRSEEIFLEERNKIKPFSSMVNSNSARSVAGSSNKKKGREHSPQKDSSKKLPNSSGKENESKDLPRKSKESLQKSPSTGSVRSNTSGQSKGKRKSKKGSPNKKSKGKSKSSSSRSSTSSTSSTASSKSKGSKEKPKKGGGCCGGKKEKVDTTKKPPDPKKKPVEQKSQTVAKVYDAKDDVSPTPSALSAVNVSPTPSQKFELAQADEGTQIKSVQKSEPPQKPPPPLSPTPQDLSTEKRVYEAKPGDERGDIYGRLLGGPIKLPICPEPCCNKNSSTTTNCGCRNPVKPDGSQKSDESYKSDIEDKSGVEDKSDKSDKSDDRARRSRLLPCLAAWPWSRGGTRPCGSCGPDAPCGPSGPCKSGGPCGPCKKSKKVKYGKEGRSGKEGRGGKEGSGGREGTAGEDRKGGGVCRGSSCCRVFEPFRKMFSSSQTFPSDKYGVVYGKFRAVANYETGELDIAVDKQSRKRLLHVINKFAVGYDDRLRVTKVHL